MVAMPKALDIAVCGAGPADLATALYVNRLGHNAVILERFEAPERLKTIIPTESFPPARE